MISIYAPNATDFSMNGLGLLLPIECTIEEQANGLYELTIVHPITTDHRWAQLQNGCIIKASAPVRESPLYEAEALESGTTTATVTRKLYRVDVNTRLRLRAKPNTSSKILGRYKDGTEVVQLQDMGNGWFQVMIRKGGATGYMSATYLDYVRTITETVTVAKPMTRQGVSVQPAREQLFRIYSTEVNTDAHTVTAKAMHVFYDLRGNPVGKAYAPEGADANAAAREVFGAALIPNDFELHSYLSGTVSGDYGFKSIPECLLDPDEGIVTQTGGMLVRDGFDIFLLPDAVRDMGVTIRRGKNLIGVTVETDMTDVVTRIIPVGTNKKGNDLFLDGTIYVDSPRIGDYPHPLAKRIDYDVKVGDGDGQFSTDAKARAELRKRAQADFDAGADLPTYGMEVDFILLGNTAEYANYASLQAVHLFDTVTVIDELIGLRAKLRVTGYKWDVLGERYESVTLGELQDLQQTTYGYTLAPGSVSGTKLINNSVGGNVLRDLSIQYAKIALATIEQLNADSITALTARINEIVAGSITTDTLYAALAEITTLMVKSITADKIETDELYAALADVILLRAEQIDADNITTDKLAAQYAEIVSLLVENISAENIQTDRLGAVLAEFVSMYASVGAFDFATIQNLVAKAMSLEQGAAESVYIKNLAVTSANLLSATLGNLVIKGNDGKYYRVFVGSTGEIGTEEVTVTNGEISAGQTTTGSQIVETNMNVANLNASNLQASSAVINNILTTALTAGKITAAEALIASATIPALYTTTIKAIGETLDLSANTSITAMVGSKATVFRSETPPSSAKANDLWIQPSTGYTFQLAGDSTALPTFYLDSDGFIYYAYGENQTVYAMTLDDNGDLYFDEEAPFAIAIDENGEPEWWQRVRDSEWVKSIGDTAAALENQINTSYSELEQRADSFEASINTLTAQGEELRTYMRYGNGVLELGRSDSRYTTQTSDRGFVVLQDGVEMASMEQNTISAPVINAQRMFTIGEHGIRLGASGHLIIN